VESKNIIQGFGGVAGTQGLTTQTLYDADLTDNSGLETTTGITVTNPLGGTYTVSLAAAITKLGQPVAQGGAGITLAAGTPGSAVVNINFEPVHQPVVDPVVCREVVKGGVIIYVCYKGARLIVNAAFPPSWPLLPANAALP
jgi:hypothetical protein